jgi:hypothetical protein
MSIGQPMSKVVLDMSKSVDGFMPHLRYRVRTAG